MKKIKLLFGLFLFFICFFSARPIKAGAYAYTIQEYHVDVNVTYRNVYEMTETIRVKFNQSRHGIVRRIPVINNVRRADGSTDRIVAKVSGIDCGREHYQVSHEGNNQVIKIGSKAETIIGEKVYTISYNYEMGNDVLPNEDEFYYNIIGNEWDTTIERVSFTIQMPKEFDEEKLGMAYGGYGSTEYSRLGYYVQNNMIIGMLDSDVVLGPGEGVTVRLTLPEGYFERVDDTPWFAYISIAIACAAMLISFFMWWTYGRDDPVTEVVEFHPPDGMNSLELAFAYKGEALKEDAVCLMVDLAQKGYIEIEETNKQNFTIVVKRRYDGTNEAEKIFMDGLLEKGERITKSSLKNSFYRTLNLVVASVNKRENKKKLFYADSINKGWILFLMSVAVYLTAGFVPAYGYANSIFAAVAQPVFTGLLFMLCFVVLFRPVVAWSQRIVFVVVCFLFGTTLFFTYMENSLRYADVMYRVAYYFAIFACGVIMFFHQIMPRRTAYGSRLLGRIRGFKNFLETAEKERLEMLVEENPEYFYEILPYAYVLDVSSIWMDKFEGITKEPPSWYHGHGRGFDFVMFHHFMNTTMSSAKSSMTSSPRSSGGGISGGGSGGGGGGSW